MSRVTELIWKSNNRSVIRDLDEMASRSEKTNRQVKKDTKESATYYERLGHSTVRVRESVATLAGTIGFGGLAFGIKDAVEGGTELQSQQAQLRAALKATGQEAGGTFEKLKSAAEGLSTKGGFATTENLKALTSFTRETHSASQATSMLSLATNIARGTGTDLATSQQLVARAYTGQVGRLQKLLGPMIAAREASVGLTTAHQQEIVSLQNQAHAMGKAGPAWLRQQEVNRHITAQQLALAQLTDKHATATQFLTLAQKEFGTATSTYSKTSAGQMSNLRNAVKNLSESLGQALLPAVSRLIRITSASVSWLSKHKVVLYALLGAVAAVSGVLAAHAVVLAIVEAKTIVVEAAQAAWAVVTKAAAAATWLFNAALDAMPLIAVAAGIYLLVTHFKTVKKVAVDVFHGMISVVQSVWHFIERAASGIFHALTWPFRKAKGIIGGVMHGAGSVLHSATFGLLHSGGVVKPKYFAMGGPVGQDTIPGWLTPGEGVVTAGTGMAAIGGAAGLAAINSGRSPFHFTIQPGVTVLKVDARVLARAVTEYSLQRGAHGASSLVGGALATH